MNGVYIDLWIFHRPLRIINLYKKFLVFGMITVMITEFRFGNLYTALSWRVGKSEYYDVI